MRYAIGRIACFCVAVAKATRVETTIHTRATELSVRAVRKSLQADPEPGEGDRPYLFENEKGGVGGIF